MFTGIVEEVGSVASMPSPGRAGQIVVAARTVLEDVALGDSIAVNGVCLTVTGFTAGRFSVDVMPETLARSGLGELRVGSRVNLERAVRLGGRMGGHIVSGHIDGTGVIASRRVDQNAVRLRVRCPRGIGDLVVEKGSVAVDGVSLTVSRLFDDGFEVSVIPHTGSATVLLERRVGQTVNLENDVIGKYVRRLMGLGGAGSRDGSPDPPETGVTGEGDPAAGLGTPGCSSQGGITLEFLRERGF